MDILLEIFCDLCGLFLIIILAIMFLCQIIRMALCNEYNLLMLFLNLFLLLYTLFRLLKQQRR